jgi:hypothetical protein
MTAKSAMRETDFWQADTRVIEIDVAGGALGSRLLESGNQGYLGVARDEATCRRIAEEFPGVADYLVVSRSKRIVRQNNADVLILNGRSTLGLLRLRNIRHARQVACPLRPIPACVLGILLGLWQCLLRRLAWPKIARLPGQRLLVFPLRRERPQAGARRYIPHALGVEGFLAQLKQKGIRHAVLRWFDSLPKLPPGEDLDLLLSDADLEIVRATLEGGPGVQPIDLYSTTGLPGADFRGMPYYPPYLAEQLLKRAIDHRGLCAVPAPREHFLSLAYHALYHKGASSGLPCNQRLANRRRTGDHDYPGVLRRLAVRLGIDVPIALEELDRYLDAAGW